MSQQSVCCESGCSSNSQFQKSYTASYFQCPCGCSSHRPHCTSQI